MLPWFPNCGSGPNCWVVRRAEAGHEINTLCGGKKQNVLHIKIVSDDIHTSQMNQSTSEILCTCSCFDTWSSNIFDIFKHTLVSILNNRWVTESVFGHSPGLREFGNHCFYFAELTVCAQWRGVHGFCLPGQVEQMLHLLFHFTLLQLHIRAV